MPLPVTGIFAGLLALWLIFLQVRVVRFRRGQRVSLGHAGDEMGERLIRAHGNASENIPIFLIMLGLSEGLGTPAWVLGLIGVLFTAGRVLHGVHFFEIREGFALRMAGMAMTFAALIITAIGLIGHALGAL
ncbi:MAG: MAPEG family protein [Pseudomonadota bacterium]